MADSKNFKQSGVVAAGDGNKSIRDTGDTDATLGKINRDLEEKSTKDRAKDMNLQYIDLASFPINPDILHLLPLEDARRAMLMPFYKAGKKLKVAVTDPSEPSTQEVLNKLEEKGLTVQVCIGSASGIRESFKIYSSDQYKLKTEVKNVVKDDELSYEKELKNLVEIKDKLLSLSAEEALNTLHVSAIKAGASDIHYQPEETKCTLRFRIDGVLHTVFEIEKEVYERLAGQLKYKAKMKLNVTTEPQDGRYRFIVNDRKIDVRVSSLPTEYGEAFVCRILDSGKHFADYAELGFSGKSLEILSRCSGLNQGMVLVTGPTSSGKTTTLYVLLKEFNNSETKIITLEDPIEYHLAGLTQSQIDEKKGYTFAAGLRSVLRQDPDVVMIGEIRDLETAEVCTQAALTGHVLLSTLHTKSAVDTISRLAVIGVPNFMIAPSLSVVIAQRLVRRLCDKCRTEKNITAAEKTALEGTLAEIKKVDVLCKAIVPEKLFAAKGCDECNNTGYRGQLVISEVLQINDEVENAILKNASSPEIFALARKQGMLTIFEDGILKIIGGTTTMSEVHRVANA